MCVPQVLESNRNQLEAKGMQLEASKDQLRMITTEIDSKDKEIAELKDQIKVMEKRLASSLKGLLLWGDNKELAVASKVSQWKPLGFIVSSFSVDVSG